MLWKKAWLDTRARFAIGVAALACTAALLVSVWLRVELNATSGTVANPSVDASNLLQFWSRNGLSPLWCLFAIILGSGGLVPQAGRSQGALFTLAMPVTRTRIVMTRVGVVLVELYLLALLPLLLVLMWTPALWRIYFAANVYVLSFSIVTGGAVFFAIPFFLSSLFEQFWVPVATMLGLAMVITVVRSIDPELSRYTLAPLLRGGDYLVGGSLPWIGLIDSAAVSAALIALAVRNIARRDF